METFGSDATPPDIASVRKVRDCDIFIGIYAHRYGTVDGTTGKSITELELDEAERSHSGGVVRDILLYLHDEKTPWPTTHEESDPASKPRMERLRARAKSHTPSYFGTADELLLAVTRDVHRKLSEHFRTSPLQIGKVALPAAGRLTQPVGMEFLSSTQKPYLIGRTSKVDEILKNLDEDPLLLLLGDSGIGKTSLINAGLMPESLSNGWRPVYVRPLGLPASDVVHQIQSSLFRGRPAYHGPLLPFLLEVAELIPERRLLIIIDQFEDVLVARSQEEVEKLIADLKAFHLSPCGRLRILVSYRADLEGRLGHFWQLISGSAAGLPRVYLEGLATDEVGAGIAKCAEDLGVRVALDDRGWKSIKRDLGLASAALGLTTIYPPYVQMLIDHLWAASGRGTAPYTAALYGSARGLDGIVGDYLGRQLKYAEDAQGHVRVVLIALVRSYGVKAQKRLDELIPDTGLDQRAVEIALKKLIDLRLVRHIDQYYEITHDFVARRVASELADSEEKEFKRFQELLSSKAAAFATTGAHLTGQELLMLYKHRERVVPGELGLRLLLVSWLEGEGPGLYWLLNPEWNAQILSWLASELNEGDRGQDRVAAAVLLKRRIEGGRIAEEDFAALRHWKHAIELASLLQRDAVCLSENLILAGLRHRREEVRRACRGVLLTRVRKGEWSLLALVRDSTSKHLREAYDEAVTDAEVPMPPTGASRLIEEVRLLRTIRFGPSERDSEEAYTRLKEGRPRRQSLIFGESLLAVRQHRIDKLLKRMMSRPTKDAELMLGALSGDLEATDFRVLLGTYERWNEREPDERETAPAAYGKIRALAEAIGRAARPEVSARLRATVKRIRLTESARALVLALLKHGQMVDVKTVLKRVQLAKSPIRFWTHTELGQAVARRMASVQPGVPDFLLNIARKGEFWDYAGDQKPGKEDRLGLGSPDNRSLYVRLAAYCAIGSAGAKDVELLVDLTTHNYTLIARAAAIRLVHLFGEDAFKKLSSAIGGGISERQGESLAGAIRFAEIEQYGVANVW